MIRSIIGFAVLAVLALVATKLFFGLLGAIFALAGMLIWLAFWGFVVYLILKLFAPDTARHVREMITG